MIKIVSKKLPNAVASADIGDPTVRTKVMLLQENIASLSAQLADAQKAIVELQGGAAKTNLNTLAAQVAPLVENVVVTESATASAAASSAVVSAAAAESARQTAASASEAAVLAMDAAVPAASAATTARTGAEAAQAASETARDEACSAASSAHVAGYVAFETFSSETGTIDGHEAKNLSVVSIAKEGYTAMAVVSVNSSLARIVCSRVVFNNDRTTATPAVVNTTTSSGSATLSFTIMYLRNDSIQQQ